MRVALYVHCFYPHHYHGTESYTLTVAKSLKAFGHEPIVVTATFQGEPPQAKFVEEYEWESIPVFSFDKNAAPHFSVEDTYHQPEMRAFHERLLRKLKPDIVHVTHLVNHTAALLDVTRALRIPTFGTLTDFFGFCLNNKLQTANGALCSGPNASRANCVECYIKDASGTAGATTRLKMANLPLVRSSLASILAASARDDRNANPRFGFSIPGLVARPAKLRSAYEAYQGLIAPSRFLHDAYARNMEGLPLTLSHFGIDIDRRAKPIRANPENLKIAYIGQVAAHKGVHLLIDALRKAASLRLSLDVWGSLAQQPEYGAQLQRQANGLAVNFRGTFPSAEAAAVLEDVDVLVIPSTWYENSPLILLQALATHTPVLVSDVEGMTEFVEHGTSGLHFKRGDVNSLARALKRFTEDPALARKMSLATNYQRTPRDMVQDILMMYEGAEQPAMTAS